MRRGGRQNQERGGSRAEKRTIAPHLELENVQGRAKVGLEEQVKNVCALRLGVVKEEAGGGARRKRANAVKHVVSKVPIQGDGITSRCGQGEEEKGEGKRHNYSTQHPWPGLKN